MEERILEILARICDDDIVKQDRDIELFDSGIVDSLDFAEMLVEMEDEFKISIPPTEIDREEINTPNKLIKMIKEKVEENSN